MHYVAKLRLVRALSVNSAFMSALKWISQYIFKKELAFSFII